MAPGRAPPGAYFREPSKGPSKSALKGEQSPVAFDRCSSLGLSTLRRRPMSVLLGHEGLFDAVVNRYLGTAVDPLWIRRRFPLPLSLANAAHGKTSGSLPGKGGGSPMFWLQLHPRPWSHRQSYWRL